MATKLGIVIVAVVLVAGCGKRTKQCAPGTLFLEVTLAAPADTLDVSITTGSDSPVDQTVTLTSGTTSGSIEIDFPHGYPSGQAVTVMLTATSAGTVVGSGQGSVTLSAGCAHLDIAVGAGGSDLGNGDDLEGADLQCAPVCPAGQCGMLTVCGQPMDCSCPIVYSVDEPLAKSGDLLGIEGSGFLAGAEVVFPGNVAVAATILSAERLTVTVPATAGTGAVTVLQNGNSSNAMPFRRASFNVGVHPLRASFEQAEYGHLMPSITPRFGATAVVGDKYVWVLGGWDGNGVNTIVEQARINADGTLGAFTMTPSLSSGRVFPSGVRIGNSVYVIGGLVNSTSSATVERAPINADGTLGTFADAGATLNIDNGNGTSTDGSRLNFATAVAGGWLYVIGGVQGKLCNPAGSPIASVERAPINADGSLGAFVDAGVALPTAESDIAAVVAGNTLYVLGGSGAVSATIAADGTIGAFAASGGSGAANVYAGFTWGGSVYEFGNFASTTSGSATYTPNGAIGTFASGTAATGTLSGIAPVAVIGHYAYQFGGGLLSCVLSLHFFGTVGRMSLQSGGDLATFALRTQGMQEARESFAAVVSGETLYAIGGQSDYAKPDVEAATLDGSGVIGPFANVSGVSLATQRAGFGAAVVGNKLYIAGGTNAGGTTLNTVEVAPIASDGTVGTFAAALANGTGAAVTLAAARSGLRLLVVGTATAPILCALGGTTEIDCAAVNSDFTLAGNLTAAAGAMNSVRTPPEAVLVGSVVTAAYGTTSASTMAQATLDSTTGGFTASFTALGGTAFSGAATASIVLGSDWLSFGGHSQMGAGTNSYSNAVSLMTIDPSSGAISSPGADPNGAVLATARELHRVVNLENKIYVLGGDPGAASDNAVEISELR
ncbi:MAG TPA: hypothetical protein VGL86_32630 [Polyangia bacterium]|jgi:hypothetical protein